MGIGLSDYVESKVIDWLFKRTAWSTSPPNTLYIGLHSADPVDTGANELAGTGSYARGAINTDTNNSTNTQFNAAAAGSPSTSKKVTNLVNVPFTPATADWNGAAAIQFWTAFDASTTGNALFTGAISGGGVVVLNGNTLVLAGGTPGQLSFQLD